MRADLTKADLRRASLRGTDLSGADLTEADLGGADLSGAILESARFVDTILDKATFIECRVYGVSAWGLDLSTTKQEGLWITRFDEPLIKVDDLAVAQFIHLLLNNENIRRIIDTITSKVVLILGRFTADRKPILDALRQELRKYNYSPVLFDCDKPAGRDITETVSTLAHLARFVIADITDAKSIPQELERIVPDLPSVPVQPLLQSGSDGYGMFEHFKRYPWVLETHEYIDVDELLAVIRDKIILPAESKVLELRSATTVK